MSGDFTIGAVARLSEEEVSNLFVRIRWGANGPRCTKCGFEKVYAHKKRPMWCCSKCKHQFSITSGTLLASHGLPLRDYLVSIVLFASAAKGMSALQLQRLWGVQYKTVYVFLHKLREAMAARRQNTILSGHVEIDGCFVGGNRRHFHERRNGIITRITKKNTNNRAVVVVARERGGPIISVVVPKESAAVFPLSRQIASGSTIHVDMAHAWDSLAELFKLMRIDHSKHYSLNGACTNQAESFFARLRRSAYGTYHRPSVKYLSNYASEMAWREEMHAFSVGAIALDLLTLALQSPPSKEWRGYWQRRAAPQTLEAIAIPEYTAAWEGAEGHRERIAAVAPSQSDDQFSREINSVIDLLPVRERKLCAAIIDGATLEEAAVEAGMSPFDVAASMPKLRRSLAPYLGVAA